jgi:hypothetical protein
MSEENVEVAREAVDAFNRRDLDAFVARVRPDAETDGSPEFEGSTVAGRGSESCGKRGSRSGRASISRSRRLRKEAVAESSLGARHRTRKGELIWGANGTDPAERTRVGRPLREIGPASAMSPCPGERLKEEER